MPWKAKVIVNYFHSQLNRFEDWWITLNPLLLVGQSISVRWLVASVLIKKPSLFSFLKVWVLRRKNSRAFYRPFRPFQKKDR